MLRKVAICTFMVSALLVSGCGSSEDSTSDEDTQAINELIANVNDATGTKDASAFCLLIQPSAIEETFHDIDRCVSETRKILKAAGDQPKLQIETVEVDGDVAKVTFVGSTVSEYNVVREDGQWYWPLDPGDVEAGASGEGSEG